MDTTAPRYFVTYQCKNRTRGLTWTQFRDHALHLMMEYKAKPWVVVDSVQVQIRDKEGFVVGIVDSKENVEG